MERMDAFYYAERVSGKSCQQIANEMDVTAKHVARHASEYARANGKPWPLPTPLQQSIIELGSDPAYSHAQIAGKLNTSPAYVGRVLQKYLPNRPRLKRHQKDCIPDDESIIRPDTIYAETKDGLIQWKDEIEARRLELDAMQFRAPFIARVLSIETGKNITASMVRGRKYVAKTKHKLDTKNGRGTN